MALYPRVTADDQENLEALELELAEINEALSFIRKGGQSYTIGSGSSQRMVTQANYQVLLEEKRSLKAQIKALEGEYGLTLGPGW